MGMHDLTVLTEEELLSSAVSTTRSPPCARNSEQKGREPRLPLAPWWASVCSLIVYCYLWYTGVVHFISAVKSRGQVDATQWAEMSHHVKLLCGVYAVETFIAAVFKSTTLLNWRFSDYLMHHVPFAIVVYGWILFEPPVGSVLFTWSFDLLTSMNEAILAARALGLGNWIDIPSKMYLLVIMVGLVVFECYELTLVLLDASNSTGLRTFTMIGLAAPVYHAVFIIPYCVKMLKRWTFSKMGAESGKAKPIKAE